MPDGDELKTGATVYSRSAQEALQEKLGYELWLLGFVLEMIEASAGGCDPGRLIFRNRQPGKTIEVNPHDVIGGEGTLRLIDAMRALTFVMCYKILDMILEWILEVNCFAGHIGRVPWRFVEKVVAIRGLRREWLPPLMQSQPHIRDYLIALYDTLLDYRNEIVHRHVFAVSNGTLTIGPTEEKPALELHRDELVVLTRVAVASACFLTGEVDYGCHAGRLLRHHLDQIQKCHGRPQFGDPQPVLENVVLVVPGTGSGFPAELAWLRNQLAAMHPGKAVLFNLEVLGTVADEPRYAWRFPSDRVPNDAVCELRPGSHDEYAISPSDIKPV